MMLPRWCVAVLLCAALCACASTPPDGPPTKRDRRMDLTMDCLHEPQRFGFPYSGEEYRRWHRDMRAYMPDLHSYCVRVGQLLVR